MSFDDYYALAPEDWMVHDAVSSSDEPFTGTGSAGPPPRLFPAFNEASVNTGSEGYPPEVLPAGQQNNLVNQIGFWSRSGGSGQCGEPVPAKVGARFSKASLKILKDWLHLHKDHPYPSSKDVDFLKVQTGLEKHQILNWYANIRRRSKTRHVRRPSSPRPTSLEADELPSQAIPCAGSRSPLWGMGPMQRWQNSPPEHEPSAASDILAAVQLSDYSGKGECAGPGSNLSDATSAASSRYNDSNTGSSAGSAYSYASRNSTGSIDLPIRKRRRHRQRQGLKSTESDNPHQLTVLARKFQCTFCAETFATKHNWQRHENSLHISLEGWECSPDGPTTLEANQGHIPACVYCGVEQPDEAHIAFHDYQDCECRRLDERMFYRKDHLRQHLMLVHRATFQEATMAQWKRRAQHLRSRCGFCGLEMNTWDERVGHIADHFKTGKSMADWQGGWGFEPHVEDQVENAIPPYLIHYERHSPWPFTSFQGAHRTPANAFELISTEMEHYWSDFMTTNNRRPTMAEMQYECCARIYGAELRTGASSPSGGGPGLGQSESWLRTLIMGNETIAREARRRPTKYTEKVSVTPLRVIGKPTLFDSCFLEQQLQQRLRVLQNKGLPPTYAQLQFEACEVVRNMAVSSTQTLVCTQEFLIHLVLNGNGRWYIELCQRAGLQKDEIDYSAAAETAEDNDRNGIMDLTFLQQVNYGSSMLNNTPVDPMANIHMNLENGDQSYDTNKESSTDLIGHDNCYRHLKKELVRFVRSSMSPFNPNRHVPSDEELQHQARWIMFDDDDPWNQTPADSIEWLHQFKKDQKLLGTYTLPQETQSAPAANTN